MLFYSLIQLTFLSRVLGYATCPRSSIQLCLACDLSSLLRLILTTSFYWFLFKIVLMFFGFAWIFKKLSSLISVPGWYLDMMWSNSSTTDNIPDCDNNSMGWKILNFIFHYLSLHFHELFLDCLDNNHIIRFPECDCHYF